MLCLCLFFFTAFLPVLQSDSVFSMSHACHPQHRNDFQPGASSVRPSDCLGLQCYSHLSKVNVAGGRENAFTRLTAHVF